ncbi:hypothetical protein CXG81DRAFT_24309 [Caulochytrium protostelioides]|uniref:MAPEG-domain-containing protein n=1 Tax=Caulochytrium protostelioides TaxID=1555241 RepID=A0A4P9XCC9_9FUNG|nr:hypothetical protein CXG81DRAFT_24309 [Caulochytrium protostelioides]|eukprot:RKP03104.1 hypothetical protein CXG81DRAFT_24309 [Caulochytrium protostelioides]
MFFSAIVPSDKDYSLYMIPALWFSWIAPQAARVFLTSRFTKYHSIAQPRVENDPTLLRAKLTQRQFDLLIRLRSAHENSLEFLALAVPVLLMQHLPRAGTTVRGRNDFALTVSALRAVYVLIYALQFKRKLAIVRSATWFTSIYVLVRAALHVAGQVAKHS